MTNARGKKLLWMATVISLVLGALVALCAYDTLWDIRAWNLIGLIYIGVIALFAAFIALTACRQAGASHEG